MFYGIGAAMGFCASQIDQMSLWQFNACFDGFSIANGQTKPKQAELSNDRLADMGIEGF